MLHWRGGRRGLAAGPWPRGEPGLEQSELTISLTAVGTYEVLNQGLGVSLSLWEHLPPFV